MAQSYFIFFILLGNSLSISKVDGLKTEKIVGGSPAAPNQFRYAVAVLYDNKNPCTGGIIADRFIITVAHCFFDEKTTQIIEAFFRIVVAITNLNEPRISTKYCNIDSIFIPKDYESTGIDTFSTKGNLAVVKLIFKLGLYRLHPHLSRLRLPLEKLSNAIRPNALLTVTGYGWNEINILSSDEENDIQDVHEQGRSDGQLRYSHARFVNNSACERIVEDRLAETVLCAKVAQTSTREPKGICRGDSGAPLVHNQIVYGVAINGFLGCDEFQMPGVYTDVHYYRHLIDIFMAGRKTSEMRIILQEELSPGVYVLKEY